MPRSYRKSQQSDKMDPVVATMRAHGYEPNVSVHIQLIMAHIEAKSLAKAWRYGARVNAHLWGYALDPRPHHLVVHTACLFTLLPALFPLQPAGASAGLTGS